MKKNLEDAEKNDCKTGTILEKIKEHRKKELTTELVTKDWRGRYYRLAKESRVDSAKSLGWHDKAGLATWNEKNLFEAREQIKPLRATIAMWERNRNPSCNVNAMCRHCGLKEETVDHITAECTKLSFTLIKHRHD